MGKQIVAHKSLNKQKWGFKDKELIPKSCGRELMKSRQTSKNETEIKFPG